MKKIILVISISLIISIGLMSYSKSINKNQLHRRSSYNKFAKTKVIAYCQNGKIIYKGNFKNGKKDGEWITYYKKEKIKSKGIYKDGNKDGEWITYDENGRIKSKEIYKDGRKVSYGTISRFSRSSKIKAINVP